MSGDPLDMHMAECLVCSTGDGEACDVGAQLVRESPEMQGSSDVWPNTHPGQRCWCYLTDQGPAYCHCACHGRAHVPPARKVSRS